MLINSIKKSYRNLMGYNNPVQPIVAAPGIRKAANESGYSRSGMQARRQRRQSRMNGVVHNGSLGWKLRAW